MSEKWKWFWGQDWIYDATLEVRAFDFKGQRLGAELRRCEWGWLDLFLTGSSIEATLPGTVEEALKNGASMEDAIRSFLCPLFDRHRTAKTPDLPFEEGNEAEVEEASHYLAVIDDSQVAADDPAFWWDTLERDGAFPATRVMEFEGSSRTVSLPRHVWMWVDIHCDGQSKEEPLAAYIAHANEAPENAARALRALARQCLIQGRKDAKTDTIFDPRFAAQLDRALQMISMDA